SLKQLENIIRKKSDGLIGIKNSNLVIYENNVDYPKFDGLYLLPVKSKFGNKDYKFVPYVPVVGPVEQKPDEIKSPFEFIRLENLNINSYQTKSGDLIALYTQTLKSKNIDGINA